MRPTNSQHIFESGGISMGKSEFLNEDAYFCNNRIIGVADGIGSLQKEFGISSKEFSTRLMENCEQLALSSEFHTIKKAGKLREIVSQAYNSIDCGGSSTFIIATLIKRQINILNLGDCGLILLRFDEAPKIIFQTTPKLHSFNTPYQISRRFSLNQLKSGNDCCPQLNTSDNISDADEFLITIFPGDIAIMGSDGLLDNMDAEEILKITYLHRYEHPKFIAQAIAKIAREKAEGTNNTPFSLKYNNLKNNNNLGYRGGKIDDITVVVAKIGLTN